MQEMIQHMFEVLLNLFCAVCMTYVFYYMCIAIVHRYILQIKKKVCSPLPYTCSFDISNAVAFLELIKALFRSLTCYLPKRCRGIH